jgi:virginiamycin A acetyltransferase
MIEIHPTAFVSSLADLESSSKGSRVVIGPNVYIDSFVSFESAGVLKKLYFARHFRKVIVRTRPTPSK